MILISGVNIFGGAIGELTDASISDSTLNIYSTILDDQSSHLAPALASIRHIRGVRSGGTVFVDLVAEVAPIATAQDVIDIAQRLEGDPPWREEGSEGGPSKVRAPSEESLSCKGHRIQ
jgi:divalent metal cation (Fe/Co/Zn/Cd) transporter